MDTFRCSDHVYHTRTPPRDDAFVSWGDTSVSQSPWGDDTIGIWGQKYFKGRYHILVKGSHIAPHKATETRLGYYLINARSTTSSTNLGCDS